MTVAWELQRGASLVDAGAGAVRFAVWAPSAKSVSVRILDPEPVVERPLERGDGGVFAGVFEGVAADARYVYALDGEAALADPVSRHQPAGVDGPSQVVDPNAFQWSDDDWTGLEMADLVLYELHVGTFTEEGTFDGVVDRLDYLKELGITAIELMPVAEFPGGRNWGYDGVFPFAPQSTYGGPDGLKRLVNEAHRRGVGVFLDVVYNHLGPEGNVLIRYGPYFTERYKTPWGAAMNFDGADSNEVRRYFIDNALYWLGEYHIDGLRLDAVHAICDFSAYNILAEIRDAAADLERRLNRRLLVVAESDLNDPRLARPAERGGYGLDAQWSDDFHHAVHVTLTGERQGYYADFDGVDSVAKAIRDRYVLDGTYSHYRRRRHGANAGDIPADRIVTFVQNHDQVGNRAKGDRLSTLVSFERQKIAAFFSLMSPYVPLLFMGEEYGETNPFQYFVSHRNPDLVEAVRKGRRSEFASFGWSEDVPDPQAEETFLRSRLDPARAQTEPHRRLSHLYRDLIQLKRGEPMLRPGAAGIAAACDESRHWVAWRFDGPDGGTQFLATVNLSSEQCRIEMPVQGGSAWTVAVSTNDQRYGGSGTAGSVEADGGRNDRLDFEAPPETALLLRRLA